jgi:hypothetical protein
MVSRLKNGLKNVYISLTHTGNFSIFFPRKRNVLSMRLQYVHDAGRSESGKGAEGGPGFR